MEKSKSGEIKLLIVTVNYFSATLVAKLIDQVIDQPLPEHISLSVVCIDNSDSPDQKSILERIEVKSSVGFKLLINPVNSGFGCAINKSVKGKEFDYLICLNPDVTLRPTTLLELLNHSLQHVDAGIWGGITVDEQLTADYRHAWQEPTIKNTLAWAFGLNRLTSSEYWQDNYRHMANKTTQPYPVDSVSGCCMLISASAWRAVGGFDSDFFLYSEEIDLCRRSRLLGFQPTVVPLAQLHHAAHSKEESIQRIQPIYSAKLLYASKHHGLLYNIGYRELISLGSLIRSLKSLSTGQLEATYAWTKLACSALIYRRKRSGFKQQ